MAARATLAYTELRAPFAATIQARRIDPGDLVGPGQPLLDLEGDALELVATLTEGEARGLALGGTVRLRPARLVARPSSPRSRRGAIRSRTAARCGHACGSANGELRSGAFARIIVPGGGGPGGGLWIPRSALVERGDLTGVFVAVEGRAELRSIALGDGAGARRGADRAPAR